MKLARADAEMAGRRRGGGEVMGSIYSVLALVLILVACVELGDAASAVDVYRLIQYDLAGAPYGSRLAGLNHLAGAHPFAPGADLSRTVLVLPIRELNLTLIQEYIIGRQIFGGLLFLLPEEIGNKNVEENKKKDIAFVRGLLSELEQLLIHANFPYPVYFGYENAKINSVLAEIQRSDSTGQPASATTGGYKLVVSTSEPKKLSSPTITNIQGWLHGLKGDGATQLPTIAVVASYDTFGAVPALSVGSDSNGSGVVALLEIARLFSRLYSGPKTRGKYNLLFGLTSGGPYNYNGTMKWLRSFDQRLRESIEYAICLNSIGSSNNELWLHVSKPPENAYIKQIYESLSDVATELGVTVEIKHKKINISNPRVAWEHEQFSRVRITAVTLSELSVAPEFLQNTGGLPDTRDVVDETGIYRNVRLVAESLAYNKTKGAKLRAWLAVNGSIIDKSSLALNPSYVSSWLDLLSRTPRVAPFLSKDDPIISALKKELSDHVDEVRVQHEILDGVFTFYDSTRATLNIYQVAGVAFDLLLLVAVGSYLIFLFSFLVITTRGFDDLLHMFRRTPSRKAKAA